MKAFLASVILRVWAQLTPGGPAGASADLAYNVPNGWTSTSVPDATVYLSPVLNNGERCQIGVFKTRPATNDVATDARVAFRDIYKMDPLENNAYPFPTATLSRGTSPQGWDYFIIQRSIHGRVGDYGTLLGAHLLAARRGTEVAVVAWAGKDPLVSMCFGSLVHDQWPEFFYSLRFKSWPGPPPGPEVFMHRLAGRWTTATASAADSYTFASNGRYGGAGALTTIDRTTAYVGDGSYSLNGNTMTLKPDGNRGGPQVRQFRLEQESRDGGATWADRLCLYQAGAGEICYTKQK